ncbi:hypothetical protein Ddc_16811 [Ditylenchus destructor]|nr:hypothetical protein Ddc_16811 [Ditylenchus destructor]
MAFNGNQPPFNPNRPAAIADASYQVAQQTPFDSTPRTSFTPPTSQLLENISLSQIQSMSPTRDPFLASPPTKRLRGITVNHIDGTAPDFQQNISDSHMHQHQHWIPRQGLRSTNDVPTRDHQQNRSDNQVCGF